MEIIELKDVRRKDSLIHYIEKYDCSIVFKSGNSRHVQDIEIILEKTALGTTDIRFEGLSKTLENNIKRLEAYINEQIKQGFFN